MSEPFIGRFTIYGVDGEHSTPYMTRYWLGRLRLHIFHRGDADPDPHDHPWSFWTFPLTPYVEEVYDPVIPGAVLCGGGRRRVVAAFRFHHRDGDFAHRVIGRFSHKQTYNHGSGAIIDPPILHTNDRKIITIVWRGHQGRKWGFWKLCADGFRQWVPWKRYVYEGGKHAPCEPR